ncbi:MAG: Gfo/Idh/MocA family oxidoreductase [Defluviitaleaceae bacterium]|nr:Gfo/Idh/MocA family oxidoreductase [Defluviitaleaceae bacterium]
MSEIQLKECVRVAQQPSLENQNRAAIIGLGGVSSVHINSLDAIGIPITALCDINPELRKRDCLFFTDYESMLAHGGFDVLHICLPHYLHAPVAIAALRRGIHVICEKPMATTVKDAESMIAASKESGAMLEIIFQNRFNPSTQGIKAIINSGELGRVTGGWIQVTWHRTQAYYEAARWRGTWTEGGGGVLINQAIHTFDLMNYIVSDTLGNPTSITGFMANRALPSIEVEDVVEGRIVYGDVNISYYANSYHPYDAPVRLEIVCENGRASLTGDVATITYNDGPTKTINNEENPHELFGKHYWGYSHIRQIQVFYDNLSGKAAPRVPGSEGLRVQRIVNGIYDSARLNKPVEF